MKGTAQWLNECRRRASSRWPASRVHKVSRHLTIGFLLLAPVCFVAAVALGIYEEREATRLMPHEPFYDVPSDGGYALIFASFFSLVLAAGFGALAAMARATAATSSSQ